MRRSPSTPPRRRAARLAGLALGATLPLGPATADACTRAIYVGLDGRVLTGRTMDWKEDIVTNLWILPRGMARDGAAPGAMRWTSRYGSVVASGYDISTTDGLNEAGLMANLQWLSPAAYPKADGRSPAMAVSVWAQYFLDRFATVAEAVEHVRREPFLVVTGEVPGQGRLATVHLSLSDPTGDSAILEWIGGRLEVHHGREYRVMTNEPTFREQLAVTAYWKAVGGLAFLPGTNRAADRFARASFFLDAVERTADARRAAAATFSVIRNASTPFGISTPDQPNISSTRWRVVADHKDRLYYFESALSPNVFWVDLRRVDFSPTGGVRKLDLGRDQSNVFAGEVSARFVRAPVFRWQPAS